jgi:hypothetical protein
MDQMTGFRVAAHLTKGKLLLAINSIAALSIFFFGYECDRPHRARDVHGMLTSAVRE